MAEPPPVWPPLPEPQPWTPPVQRSPWKVAALVVGILAALFTIVLVPALLRDDRPGDPAVYDDIAQETDCVSLGQTYVRGVRNSRATGLSDRSRDAAASYARAARDRMDDLDC